MNKKQLFIILYISCLIFISNNKTYSQNTEPTIPYGGNWFSNPSNPSFTKLALASGESTDCLDNLKNSAKCFKLRNVNNLDLGVVNSPPIGTPPNSGPGVSCYIPPEQAGTNCFALDAFMIKIIGEKSFIRSFKNKIDIKTKYLPGFYILESNRNLFFGNKFQINSDELFNSLPKYYKSDFYFSKQIYYFYYFNSDMGNIFSKKSSITFLAINESLFTKSPAK